MANRVTNKLIAEDVNILRLLLTDKNEVTFEKLLPGVSANDIITNKPTSFKDGVLEFETKWNPPYEVLEKLAQHTPIRLAFADDMNYQMGIIEFRKRPDDTIDQKELVKESDWIAFAIHGYTPEDFDRVNQKKAMEKACAQLTALMAPDALRAGNQQQQQTKKTQRPKKTKKAAKVPKLG